MPTVAAAMLTEVKTIQPDASVDDLRAFFADEHVHAALLVRDGRLESVVTRDDLETANTDGRLDGRTVAPDADLDRTLELMQRTGQRRLAVVDAEDRLLGLLALKHSGTGFCGHDDLAARRAERTRGSTST